MSTSPTIPTGFSGPVPVRKSRALWLKLSQSRSGDSTIASGTVSAGEFPGGLIGVHIGIVRDSVAIGDVIATTDAGGLIADRSRLGEQGTVRDSYWDRNAIGLTTAEMQGSATAQNLALGFEETWQTVSGDYPELIALSDSDSPETDITNPVIVSPNPATDPEDDGKLENVTGDGEATFDDAIVLPFNTGAASVTENSES
jgi:hypothetical protein